MSLQIVSDSSCDLPKELVDRYAIEIVPFLITYGDDIYYKDYHELSSEEFYNTLKARDCRPKTSMPTAAVYQDCFEKFAAQGKDIICFTITSKFSGSYSSAVVAAEIIREKYPEIRVAVVDSMTVAFMQGRLAQKAAELAAEGKDIDEIVPIMEDLKTKVGAVITVETLVYLQRGGRIGKVSSIAGDLLNIKPIIKVTEGELIPGAKVRTRKKSLDKIIETVRAMSASFSPEAIEYFPLHTGAYDEAEQLGQMFTAQTSIQLSYAPLYLGCTIGAHTGPGVVGIGFFVNE